MPRIQSEIFEEYAKLADKVGLTKLAEDSAELTKYKEDPEARVGSDDLKTIEMMYGVRPDTDASMEYSQNIMEVAHPNSVIIAPSYDKINALVENEMERQNISINLVMAPPTGNHTNRKYAQELMLELVRIANEMDARNNEELFKLADSCLIDLSACQRRPQIKEALAPLAIAGIAAAIAAVLGAGWLSSHSDNTDHGPLANADNAIKALKNLKENSWYESDVDHTVQSEADGLIQHITQLKQAMIKFNQVSDMVYKPRTLSELNELIKMQNIATAHGDEIADAVNEFKKEVLELEPLISQSIKNFSDEYYQKQHTKPSMLGEMTGWLGEALHGRWGLVANDFQSAVNALNPLQKSLTEMTTKVKDFNSVVAKYEADVKDAYAKLDNRSGNVSGNSGGSSTVTNSPPTKDNDYEDIISSITGKNPTGGELAFLKHLMGNDDL